jgi:hypothetical protein
LPHELLSIPFDSTLNKNLTISRTISKGCDKGLHIESSISSLTSQLIYQFSIDYNLTSHQLLFDISKEMLSTGVKTIFSHSGVDFEWMNLHRLRTYSASASARGGCTSIELQSLGRWSNPSIPQKYYIDEHAKTAQSRSAFLKQQSVYSSIQLKTSLSTVGSTTPFSGISSKESMQHLIRQLSSIIDNAD